MINFHYYEFYYIASSKNSTSTNFIPIALKIVLVEFVLVETVLVGDPLMKSFESPNETENGHTLNI
jgi:hypothetical protein